MDAMLGIAAFAVPAMAQSEIVFQSGTGDATVVTAQPTGLAFKRFSCTGFQEAKAKLLSAYSEESSESIAAPQHRLDRSLLDETLASYEKHVCLWGSGSGPSMIVVVDFAKRSSEPRLYALDLESGQGIDTPVVVAHGIGSDPDDDGYADAFGNVYQSWMSSLGAARGGELYRGRNGLSLRLDGLDPSNSAMRQRDIVVHSYAAERRRYFNYSLMSARGGKPGTSEGCFVVEPHRRDWLYDRLRDGGFLYAGLGKKSLEVRQQLVAGNPVAPVRSSLDEVTFRQGTGD
ncbi:MAG: murein L,D-transpeptidase catalytic domain family protein [Sphingomonadales bacterium]|nr:murein L,D-transpeptidase catalytic domain family protein [Sphingomonadales bacterium]